MKKLLSAAFAFAALLLAPSTSQAGGYLSDSFQGDGHWYVGGSGGAQHIPNLDYYASGSTTSEQAFDCGWRAGAHGGYAFGGGARMELEVSFSRNETDRIINEESGNWSSDSGTFEMWTIMFNSYYDFHLENHDVVPYFGGGIGVGFACIESTATSPSSAIKDDTTVVSFHSACGVRIPVEDNFNVTVEYRFGGTGQMNLIGSTGGSPSGAISTGDIYSHSINAGIVFDL